MYISTFSWYLSLTTYPLQTSEKFSYTSSGCSGTQTSNKIYNVFRMGFHGDENTDGICETYATRTHATHAHTHIHTRIPIMHKYRQEMSAEYLCMGKYAVANSQNFSIANFQTSIKA